MRALILLTALTMLMAGCTDGNGPAGGAGSGDHQQKATNAAHAIDPAAELFVILGPEWASETFGDQLEADSPEAATMNQGPDSNVGDGKANAWAYLYATDGDPILVVMSAGGKVLEASAIDPKSNTAGSYDQQIPLGSFSINSVEAAKVVHENNPEFVAEVGHEDSVSVMALGREAEQDVPFWVFTAFRESGDGAVFALVNAEDGSYVEFPTFG